VFDLPGLAIKLSWSTCQITIAVRCYRQRQHYVTFTGQSQQSR
jgi:hypothetical protein